MYKGDAGNFYSFNLEKRFPTCDIYALLTISEDKKVYIVPAKNAMQTQISIGENESIYHKYLNQIDIVNDYVNAFQSIGEV